MVYLISPVYWWDRCPCIDTCYTCEVPRSWFWTANASLVATGMGPSIHEPRLQRVGTFEKCRQRRWHIIEIVGHLQWRRTCSVFYRALWCVSVFDRAGVGVDCDSRRTWQTGLLSWNGNSKVRRTCYMRDVVSSSFWMVLAIKIVRCVGSGRKYERCHLRAWEFPVFWFVKTSGPFPDSGGRSRSLWMSSSSRYAKS